MSGLSQLLQTFSIADARLLVIWLMEDYKSISSNVPFVEVCHHLSIKSFQYLTLTTVCVSSWSTIPVGCLSGCSCFLYVTCCSAGCYRVKKTRSFPCRKPHEGLGEQKIKVEMWLMQDDQMRMCVWVYVWEQSEQKRLSSWSVNEPSASVIAQTPVCTRRRGTNTQQWVGIRLQSTGQVLLSPHTHRDTNNTPFSFSLSLLFSFNSCF